MEKFTLPTEAIQLSMGMSNDFHHAVSLPATTTVQNHLVLISTFMFFLHEKYRSCKIISFRLFFGRSNYTVIVTVSLLSRVVGKNEVVNTLTLLFCVGSCF